MNFADAEDYNRELMNALHSDEIAGKYEAEAAIFAPTDPAVARTKRQQAAEFRAKAVGDRRRAHKILR